MFSVLMLYSFCLSAHCVLHLAKVMCISVYFERSDDGNENRTDDIIKLSLSLFCVSIFSNLNKELKNSEDSNFFGEPIKLIYPYGIYLYHVYNMFTDSDCNSVGCATKYIQLNQSVLLCLSPNKVPRASTY